MTIRIRIANLDTRENAVVRVEKVDEFNTPISQKAVELKGGESAEEYCYQGQRLLVTEVKNG